MLAPVTAAALCALVLSACGVPTATVPTALDPNLGPAPASAAPTSSTATHLDHDIYLATADGLLRAVPRRLMAGSGSEPLAQVLDLLVAGPTASEQARGLSSALPAGLTLSASAPVNGIVVVDIAGDDPGPGVEQARLIIGGIVLTMTSLDGVDAVRLTRNGQPLDGTLPDASLSGAPLTAADFASLLG